MITLKVGDSWLLTWDNPDLPNDVLAPYLPLHWVVVPEYGTDVLQLDYATLFDNGKRCVVRGKNPGFARVRCDTDNGFGPQMSDYFEILTSPMPIDLPLSAYEWLTDGAQFDPAKGRPPLRW